MPETAVSLGTSSKNNEDGPRWPPTPPKMVQDGLQDGLRKFKTAQDGPRGPPQASQTAQEASK
eukprot:8290985-Pyramimonas_sp.AAC.1